MFASPPKKNPISAWAPLAATTLLSLLLPGCASWHAAAPSSLPASLQAMPVEDPLKIDLSQFGAPPATANNQIGRGDVLEVSLAAGLDREGASTITARVGEDGTAVLPEIGRLPLAGLSVTEAESRIGAASVERGLFRQPQVTVLIKQRQLNRITVLGAVKKPGTYELVRDLSYLPQAVTAAGGLTDDADTRIEVRRPVGPVQLASSDPGQAQGDGVRQSGNVVALPERQEELVCLNLADVPRQTDQRVYLDDGSVVSVMPRRPEPVQVMGLVARPGLYPFPVQHELRVLGAIAQAGGPSSQVASKALVRRRGPDGRLTTIGIDLERAKADPAEDVRLAPGDLVSVEHTPATIFWELIHTVRVGLSASVPLLDIF